MKNNLNEKIRFPNCDEKKEISREVYVSWYERKFLDKKFVRKDLYNFHVCGYEWSGGIYEISK